MCGVANLRVMWRVCVWCGEFACGVASLCVVWRICVLCGEFACDVANLRVMWHKWPQKAYYGVTQAG